MEETLALQAGRQIQGGDGGQQSAKNGVVETKCGTPGDPQMDSVVHIAVL